MLFSTTCIFLYIDSHIGEIFIILAITLLWYSSVNGIFTGRKQLNNLEEINSSESLIEIGFRDRDRLDDCCVWVADAGQGDVWIYVETEDRRIVSVVVPFRIFRKHIAA